METAALLKRLTEARGPSGYEAEIRQVVVELFSPHADEVETDAMGNVIARRTGIQGEPRPSVMLAAHMDEIALMVKQVEKGFLRVVEVGGFDPRVLLGQEVVVHAQVRLPGVIVTIPPHFTEPAQRGKTVPLDELFVDVGLPPYRVAELVRIGDLITLDQSFARLGDGWAAGKAMDDRAAVAALAICLEELSVVRHGWDVYAVATVQEETTMVGAVVSAYSVAPAVGIAVDVTFGGLPGLPEAETFALGKGPTICAGPVMHPRVFDALVDAAKALEIPYQVEFAAGSTGTDAQAIQISRSGIPAGLVGIPLRYMHTPIETLALKDVERAGRLLAGFIARLDGRFLETLSGKPPSTPEPPAASSRRGEG